MLSHVIKCRTIFHLCHSMSYYDMLSNVMCFMPCVCARSSAVRCGVVWCDVMWCDVMWCDVMWCRLYTTILRNLMLCAMSHYSLNYFNSRHAFFSESLYCAYSILLFLPYFLSFLLLTKIALYKSCCKYFDYLNDYTLHAHPWAT